MMGSVFLDLWELEWRNASSAFPKTDVGTGYHRGQLGSDLLMINI